MKYLKKFRLFEMDESQEEEDVNQPQEREVYLVFTDNEYRSFFVSAELGFKNDIPYVLGPTIEQEYVMSYDDEAMTEVFDRYKKAGLTTHLKKDSFDETKADIRYKGWYVKGRNDYEGFFEINTNALNKAFSDKKLYLEKDEEAEDETYIVQIK